MILQPHGQIIVILLYAGLGPSFLRRLQLVHSALSRFLTGTRKRITPVLALLHWLPVRLRLGFKILLLVFKVWVGAALFVHIHPPVRAPRSSSQTDSDSEREATVLFWWLRPILWNRTPFQITTAQTADMFKSRLKTDFYLLTFTLTVTSYPHIYVIVFCPVGFNAQ